MQLPPERLGSFYLGAEYDLRRGAHTGVPIIYDARDLTTHALCVGMTGSGKTGLCLGLLEEAALDSVPAILVDPKGDISNLLLQFPDLAPQDFAPWVSPEDAQRAGKGVAEYAADVAARWRQGLQAWGMGPERLRTLKESVDYALYTPGSDAGLPVNILGSLAAPRLNLDDHAETVRERISGTVNALLGLVGIAADPVQSREAILLATIFEHYWRQNQDLDLAQLILSLQNPPVRQFGVLDVDTFYPQKERFELAMAFNNLMASPKFQNWLQGEALDIDALLYTAAGKPRHSIFYLAHLADPERMFFVTLLLESVLTWVRRQSGTHSLRALLYFDEVYGYLPPVAQPPAKKPLMTLVKQSRAVGLGCILATQNPADVDYKSLTNIGTWFIGRLQAERDKLRVIDGLQNAIAESGRDSQAVDYGRLLGQLRPRIFLMHNVHADEPLIMETRWVLSYLHGPLTRPQIQALVADPKERGPATAPATPAMDFRSQPEIGPAGLTPPPGFSTQRQALEPGIPQLFLPVSLDAGRVTAQRLPAARLQRAQLVYQPAILGAASVQFFDPRQGISQVRDYTLLAPTPDRLGNLDWSQATPLPIPSSDLAQQPASLAAGQGPFFAPVPEAANSAAELKGIARTLADWLYYNSQLALLAHPELNVVQQPGEPERQFKLRLHQAARERRDAEMDELRRRYAGRIQRIEARLRKQKLELEQEEADYGARKREELIATVEMLFTMLTRRRLYRSASWTASRRRLASRARLEVEERQQTVQDLESELSELRQELEQHIDRITPKWVDILKGLTTYSLRPRRADVQVKLVGLAWVPAWVISYSEGTQTRTATFPAFAGH